MNDTQRLAVLIRTHEPAESELIQESDGYTTKVVGTIERCRCGWRGYTDGAITYLDHFHNRVRETGLWDELQRLNAQLERQRIREDEERAARLDAQAIAARTASGFWEVPPPGEHTPRSGEPASPYELDQIDNMLAQIGVRPEDLGRPARHTPYFRLRISGGVLDGKGQTHAGQTKTVNVPPALLAHIREWLINNPV